MLRIIDSEGIVLKSNKTSAVTSLDIGTHTIKCVEIFTSTAPELVRAAAEPAGRDTDLKSILQKFDLSSSTRVRVSLSGASIITRFITMPEMNAKELQGAIRFEAESHIPFSIDECVLDYQVLKQDAATKQMRIVLVAAKRDLVESRYKLLAEAGVHPEVIDLDVFCLLNAFEALNTGVDEKSYGLLNVGHNVSSLAIVHEGLPVFAREIPQGGLHVTKALSEVAGITEAQAETMKIEKPAGAADNLKAATVKGFESLSEEVRHSIDFVENEIKGDVKKIYLSGGGALAAGGAEILTEDIGKPVVFWDNQKKMRISSSVDGVWMRLHAAQLNVALGMALRGQEASKP